jgi:hypothetical protein
MTLRGARDDMLVGFNSLGAWASVNHLHMHVLLAGGDMFESGVAPIQHAPAKLNTVLHASNGAQPVKVYKTTTYPLHTYVFSLKQSSPQHQVSDDVTAAAASPSAVASKRQPWQTDLSLSLSTHTSPYEPYSFGFTPSTCLADRLCPPLAAASSAKELSADLNASFAHLAARAGDFVKQLQLLDVPHTVLVADGGRTIYVLPRRVQQDVNDGQLNIALAESIGLPVVTTQHAFDSVTPEYLLDLYNFFCVSPSTEAVLDGLLAESAEFDHSCHLLPIRDAVSQVLLEAKDSQLHLQEGTPVPGKRIDLPAVEEAKDGSSAMR